jgi:hypothetical protein
MERDEKAVYLQIIQGVITRMGSNSFVLKGWNVTLVSALFALAAKDSNSQFILIAILPAVAFWCLDAFYLRQERLFRKLYEDVCSLRTGSQAFAPYSMNTGKYEGAVASLFQTILAPAVFVLHGVIVTIIVVTIVILCCAK